MVYAPNSTCTNFPMLRPAAFTYSPHPSLLAAPDRTITLNKRWDRVDRPCTTVNRLVHHPLPHPLQHRSGELTPRALGLAQLSVEGGRLLAGEGDIYRERAEDDAAQGIDELRAHGVPLVGGPKTPGDTAPEVRQCPRSA